MPGTPGPRSWRLVEGSSVHTREKNLPFPRHRFQGVTKCLHAPGTCPKTGQLSHFHPLCFSGSRRELGESVGFCHGRGPISDRIVQDLSRIREFPVMETFHGQTNVHHPGRSPWAWHCPCCQGYCPRRRDKSLIRGGILRRSSYQWRKGHESQGHLNFA